MLKTRNKRHFKYFNIYLNWIKTKQNKNIIEHQRNIDNENIAIYPISVTIISIGCRCYFILQAENS